MAKRLGDYNPGYPKKQKTDIDHLWGDDFDVQDVDDCFQLASQICDQEITCTQRNVSIVPSYTAFKQQTKRTFTSTQSNPELHININKPSTSTNGFKVSNGINHNHQNTLNTLKDNGFKRTYSFENDKVQELESKLRQAQDQFYMKEGEVSFLRSQLKDIKLVKDKEQMNKEKEWSEKHSEVIKQLNATKCDLEFKDLEILNLKQQVTDKIKAANVDSSINLTQSPFFKHPKNIKRFTQTVNDATNTAFMTTEVVKEGVDKDFTIQYTIETNYPLQQEIESTIFHIPVEENYSADIKNVTTHRNTIPFLQNQISRELTEKLIQVQPKRTILPNGAYLSIDYIQFDIFNLMKCSVQQLEMQETYIYINKILCTSEQLIDNLYKFLLELEKGFVSDNSGTLDMLYLKNNFNTINPNQSLFSPEDWLANEMGKHARQSIACIAHILPYSSYLRQYLIENKRLIFTGNEDYLSYLSVTQSKLQNNTSNYHYLNLILSVINICGKLRNAHNLSGFLCAVCLLLNKIYSCDYVQDLHPLINRLTREIVFVCPNIQVLSYLSDFFKSASLHSVFVNDLCKMSSKGGLKIDQKEKIVYYKQDVCMLQVFCVLVECSSSKIKCSKVLELYSTVMIFITRCFKINPPWIYYQESKHCDCLCKIVKLNVDILYQILEEYKKTYCAMADLRRDKNLYTDELSRLADLLINGIEVLQILKFKVYDIIVKYVHVYLQYKVIIKSLMTLKQELNLTETHVKRLEDLIDIEEIPTLDQDMSDSSLWN